MHFSEKVYRPPMEAMLGAKLLQVTVGCPHNKCRFCNMYRTEKFSVEPIEQIEEDILELRSTYRKIERIYLVNGDPFALSAKFLKEIAETIIKHIPEIQVITMYSSIYAVRSKTDEELSMLKELRINDLWIGSETGNEKNLEYIGKKTNVQDTLEQCERLNNVGIRHNQMYIMGIGGHEKGIENAIDSAKLINATKPSTLFVTSLGVFEGAEVVDDVDSGRFVLANEGEILAEIRKLIELIDVPSVKFYATHPTNALSLHGILPAYKNMMFKEIDDFVNRASEEFLNSSMARIAD